jgi:hypothetical protein
MHCLIRNRSSRRCFSARALLCVCLLAAAFTNLTVSAARAATLHGRIVWAGDGAATDAAAGHVVAHDVALLSSEETTDRDALGWLPAALVVPRGERGIAATARDATTGTELAAQCLGTTGYCGYQIVLVRVACPPADAAGGAAPAHAIEITASTAPGGVPALQRRRVDGEQAAREAERVRQLVANPADVDAQAPHAPARRAGNTRIEAAGGFHPTADPSLDGSGVRYLVITTAALQASFQPLVDWKTSRGVPAAIRTVEWIESRTRQGVDRAETIRNFIVEAYALWGIEWVLIGGDTAVIPARFAWSGVYGGGTVPTDLYFACLDGTWNKDGDDRWGEGSLTLDPSESDIYPELGVARATVNNAAEAQVFVERVINYERPAIADYQGKITFLSEVLIPANWDSGQTISYDGAAGTEDMIYESVPPAFNVQRLYDSYWRYPGSTKLSHAAAIAAMNAGTGIVNHLGHGFRYTMSCGDESLVNADADALGNGNRLFELMMANCAAVAFDYNCLAERFLLNPGGGAAGVIGAARSVSASLIVTYNRAFYRQLFENGHVEQADVLNEMRLERAAIAELDGSDRWIQFSLNALGDPEMTLWTAAVRTPTLQHTPTVAAAAETLAVTVLASAQPVAGARLCVQKASDVYATAFTGPAGQAQLAIAPQTAGPLYLTVSGQNLETHTDTLQVLAPTGPVLAVASLDVDDDTSGQSQGNGDGAPDAGETLEIAVHIINHGVSAADSVTGLLAAPDAQVTLLQDSLAAGDIGAGQTVTPVAPFVVHIAAGVSDGKTFDLPLVLRDRAGQTWNAAVHLMVAAPRPEIVRVHVNGAPSAALVAVDVKNFGSGNQLPLTGTLTSADSNVVVASDTMHFTTIAPLATASGAPPLGFADSTGAPVTPVVLQLGDAYGRSLTLSVDRQPPPAPTVPVADLSVLPGTVRLTWPVSSAADHFGWHVFRATAGTGVFARLTPDAIRHTDFYDGTVVSNAHYDYYVVDVDSSRQWSAASPTLTVNTTASAVPPWPLDLSDPCATSVAVGDLDGDSSMEVVVADKGVYAWHADGQEVLDGDHSGTTYGVFSLAPGAMNASIALAQLDGAPGKEIIAASWLTNKIYIWNVHGQLLPGWPREPASGGNVGYWGSPCVGDVDGDGSPEIVIVSKDSYVYAWHVDGTPLIPNTNGAVRQVGAWTQTTPALADLDGDGKAEIIVSGALAKVFVLRYDGSDFPGWPYTLYALGKGSPAVGDVDGDGSLDIVITSESELMYVFRSDGTILPGWPKSVYGDAPDFGPSPALGDLNGDGRLEIVHCAVQKNPYSLTKLFVFDAAGNTLLTKPLDLNSQSSPILADIDGDGTIDIVHGGEAGVLHAWNLAGQELAGFPIPLGDWIRGTPMYCDLDHDGNGDLVLAGWNKKVFAWAMTGPYRIDRAPWPTFHGNVARTGYLPRSFATATAETPLPRQLTVAWSPNPFNPSVTLHFAVPGGVATDTPAAAVRVRVAIYDPRGRRVRTLLDAPRAPGRYTLQWDGRDGAGSALPSGVYLYRVEAGKQSSAGKLTLLR